MGMWIKAGEECSFIKSLDWAIGGGGGYIVRWLVPTLKRFSEEIQAARWLMACSTFSCASYSTMDSETRFWILSWKDFSSCRNPGITWLSMPFGVALFLLDNLRPFFSSSKNRFEFLWLWTSLLGTSIINFCWKSWGWSPLRESSWEMLTMLFSVFNSFSEIWSEAGSTSFVKVARFYMMNYFWKFLTSILDCFVADDC